jgi:hypothetical protein
MIEGLKVTVAGSELRRLAGERADYHAERVTVYVGQIDGMKAAQVEGVQYTNGDPVQALEGRRAQHENDSRELRFIAEHIDVGETYLLDRDALIRLGIVSSRY